MYWYPIKDRDPRAVAIFRRHYSCRKPEIDYCRHGFSGNGETMVLLTQRCDALYCWRKVTGQGVLCSIFRNESDILSSILIIEACELAWSRWPDTKLFTYVNANKITSSNPGYCFIMAGFKRLKERTSRGLYILERVI